MTVLNTIVADQLIQFKKDVDAAVKAKKGTRPETAIKTIFVLFLFYLL